MDRISKAVYRLWGSLGTNDKLHDTPRFADELSAQCSTGKLALRDERVSKWSYGEQLEHLYRSSHYVLDRLEEAMSGANADERRGVWGHGLMTAGFIPRGFFPTIPPLEPEGGTIDQIGPLRESLKKRLAEVDLDLRRIKASPGRSLHPRMKWLTSSEWFFFADVHHRHHLSIMRDIARTARR
ncbi:MAG: DinB family protein [Acidobacteria bacterium]|nr:DinB family protein [Acidobacteriota bacterium]MBV9477683.1 DinB family protein [Acidobacteriota bacterium]